MIRAKSVTFGGKVAAGYSVADVTPVSMYGVAPDGVPATISL
jgi:hypothetical protein